MEGMFVQYCAMSSELVRRKALIVQTAVGIRHPCLSSLFHGRETAPRPRLRLLKCEFEMIQMPRWSSKILLKIVEFILIIK